MKKIFFTSLLLCLAFSSCSFFGETIKMDQVIAEKQKIDTTRNPAKKRLLQHDLKDKKIALENILVKDVTISTNIDYDFCIIADVTVNGKKVECFIYSKNIKAMSTLIKGKSKINVKGTFSRFFTILDDYYTKMDIVEAKIWTIEEEAEDKEEKPEKETPKEAKKEPVKSEK